MDKKAAVMGWKCAKCGNVNTESVCQCGMEKADSALQYQKQQAKKAKKEARGNVIMSVVGIFLILVALGALGYFVFYPYVIYPQLEATDLNTPEMVQVYYHSDPQGDTVFTVTGCTPKGQVYATYEVLKDGSYGRVKLEGQITKKKNSGDLTVSWQSQTADVDDAKISDIPDVTITGKWEKAQIGDLSLAAAMGSATLLQTPEDLQKLRNADGLFLLMADLDLKYTAHTPIEGFTGTLLGNGHTIKNMNLDTTGSQIGLFATLEGRILSLDLVNASVTVSGKCENVGVLCGTLTGFAANISVSGEVTAEEGTNVGGICGQVQTEKSFTAAKLYNDADVTGYENVGGIFGTLQNSADGITLLHSCKNTGEITGSTRVGGLCGALVCNAELLKETQCSTRKGEKYGN